MNRYDLDPVLPWRARVRQLVDALIDAAPGRHAYHTDPWVSFHYRTLAELLTSLGDAMDAEGVDPDTAVRVLYRATLGEPEPGRPARFLRERAKRDYERIKALAVVPMSPTAIQAMLAEIAAGAP